jgi:hypothetical protein
VHDAGEKVVTRAQNAGDIHADAVRASMQKLRDRAEFVVKTLAVA